MTEDPRIAKYQQALKALLEGEFRNDIPIGPDDDVGALGKLILGLSHTLEQRFEQEEKLSEVSKKINEGLFISDVLDHVYESFRPLIPYDRIGCALLDKGGSVVRACWSRSDMDDVYLKDGFSAPLAGSSLEALLESGKPRILNDLAAYLEAHPNSVSTRLIVNEGIRSSLTCPLVAMGKPVGFLFFSSKTPQTYANVHQDVFRRLAGQLSNIVEKSRLYQQLFELNRELTEARDALKVQATHDALTGLWNRGAILEIVERHVSRAVRGAVPLAVALIDIDFFKRVNDTYGHQAGDAVLKEVATRISRAVRHGDFLGRYGGEEFLLMLGSADGRQALEIGERIRLCVAAEPIPAEDESLTVTLSMGMAVIEGAAKVSGTSDQVINVADRALYRAKREGRNRVEVALL
jgi:diguanylate cyclase (GGDEF)-like protein